MTSFTLRENIRSMEQISVITSIEGLVEALGGTGAAAAALDAKHPSVVSMWMARGNIPPKHFPRHAEILKQRGLTAKPSLWFGDAA